MYKKERLLSKGQNDSRIFQREPRGESKTNQSPTKVLSKVKQRPKKANVRPKKAKQIPNKRQQIFYQIPKKSNQKPKFHQSFTKDQPTKDLEQP